MSDEPRLSSITSVGFEAIAAIDAGNGDKVSLRDIYNGLDHETLFQNLASKITDLDLGLLTGTEEGSKAVRVLYDAAEAFRGRERRKIGVENSGLSLLVALVLEAIQQGNFLHPSTWPEHSE
jgi:hypothetical protein